MDPLAVGLAYLGAVLPQIGGLAGSCIGILRTGRAGTAALAEDPTQFRNAYMLAALPITQTFYGLIVTLQLITLLNTIVSRNIAFELWSGLAILGIGLMGFAAELLSAAFQGSIAATGIAELPRTKGKILFHNLILAIYAELIGILGMVFCIVWLTIIRGVMGV